MGQRLGQHFLKNPHKLRIIADSLDILPSETVIEIGSGHGELTAELLTKDPKKLIAIECDEAFEKELHEKFSKNPAFSLVLGDAFKELEKIVGEVEYKLVGNLPYYITGRIFRVLGELENKPKTAVFLIQKEVAERICVKKGEMNLFAATVQVWGSPEVIDYISRKDFLPPPKVESAVIKISLKTDFNQKFLEKYFQTAKMIFKQPRKTILNNLRESGLKSEDIKNVLEKIKIDPNNRPQGLSIEDIKKIAENLEK